MTIPSTSKKTESPQVLEQQLPPQALKMAIVYHSNYGHTRRVAKSIAKGAHVYAEEMINTQIMVKTVDISDLDDAAWTFMDDAQMLIFGSAVYMGSVPAEFKTFMDSTSKRWFHRSWHGKWAAGFANSGGLSGDKLAVLQQICLFSMQHGMNWTGFPVMPTGHTDKDVNRLSSFLGLMTQSLDGPPEQTPGEGDINSAIVFGEHLAQILVDQPPKFVAD